jgi:hypothetical protein
MKTTKRRTLDDLTPAEMREQVVLCHQHMERCCDVLDGKQGVKPVELVDVSDSADLELFYQCKKVAELSRLSAGVMDEKRYKNH